MRAIRVDGQEWRCVTKKGWITVFDEVLRPIARARTRAEAATKVRSVVAARRNAVDRARRDTVILTNRARRY